MHYVNGLNSEDYLPLFSYDYIEYINELRNCKISLNGHTYEHRQYLSSFLNHSQAVSVNLYTIFSVIHEQEDNQNMNLMPILYEYVNFAHMAWTV